MHTTIHLMPVTVSLSVPHPGAHVLLHTLVGLTYTTHLSDHRALVLGAANTLRLCGSTRSGLLARAEADERTAQLSRDLMNAASAGPGALGVTEAHRCQIISATSSEVDHHLRRAQVLRLLAGTLTDDPRREATWPVSAVQTHGGGVCG